MGSTAGADLRSADLTVAYLTLAHVYRADMRGAKLCNINLRFAEGVTTVK